MRPLFNSIMFKGAQEQSLYLFSRKQPNDNLFQARTGNDVSLYIPVIYLDFIAHKTDRIGFPYVPTRSDCNVFNEPIERTEILAWARFLFSVRSLILETVYSLLILANDPPLISNHASGFRTMLHLTKLILNTVHVWTVMTSNLSTREASCKRIKKNKLIYKTWFECCI